MIQRISIRLRIISEQRTLLIRRADGRLSILGKYELPGGMVKGGEQPEDAAKRYVTDDLGIKLNLQLQLEDVMTYTDSDDRAIQYAVIVYRASISKTKRAISLSNHYDKYIWYSFGKLEPAMITDVSRLLLGTSMISVPRTDESPHPISMVKEQGAFIYTDGGSRGNPGPSAAGYVVIKEGRVVDEGGEYLGITTNNLAEYHGVRLGLEAALNLGVDSVEVRIDSMLVVNQLKGIYKIKNRELWPINERVNELIGQFKFIKFTHVPREMNQLADGMVNRTLDQQRAVSVL